MRICRQSLTLLLLLVAGGAWCDTSRSAILQINSVPTPPAPVITPNGGTFDQPLTVSITPAVSTVLGNTPGWRTGVKYPGQGIETVEALSQDGTTVGAMRGRTMAKSSYLFPGANMSPDMLTLLQLHQPVLLTFSRESFYSKG